MNTIVSEQNWHPTQWHYLSIFLFFFGKNDQNVLIKMRNSHNIELLTPSNDILTILYDEQMKL